MKTKRVAFLIVMFVVVNSFHAHNACATPVLWYLARVTFNDGGRANGTFTFDADTLQYSPVGVTVSGGNFPAIDFNHLFFGYFVAYGPADWATFDGQSLDSRFLSLQYSSPLTNAGGTVALAGGTEASHSWGFRNIVSGFVTTSPESFPDVPEPASLMLLASGLAGLGILRRKRG